jgi:hypothetical protein
MTYASDIRLVQIRLARARHGFAHALPGHVLPSLVYLQLAAETSTLPRHHLVLLLGVQSGGYTEKRRFSPVTGVAACSIHKPGQLEEAAISSPRHVRCVDYTYAVPDNLAHPQLNCTKIARKHL